jgi:hypothetical protein
VAALGAFIFGFLGGAAGAYIGVRERHNYVYAGLGAAIGAGLGALL